MALNRARVLREVSRSCAGARCFSAAAEAEKVKVEVSREDGRFRVKTFNAISPLGLERFPASSYDVSGAEPDAHAILLRSHKLKEEDVDITVRAIARCGAGTNNIPVDRMTELGIPVFNTPGANANAVKELVIAGLFLASRDIVGGANHMTKLHQDGIARERVEKDKALFGGGEIAGKTLGVIGLGHIGAAVAQAAANLGMRIVGYDPMLTPEAAIKLPPHETTLVDDVLELAARSDYISLHTPYIKGVTHHLINDAFLERLPEHAHVLNFARGEIVDSDAMMRRFATGASGKYVSDFPDEALWDHPSTLLIPHLGASTEEAESAAAAMAAETIRIFLETGTIRHSVNFPEVKLAPRNDSTCRVCVINKNVPGALADITNIFADAKINVLQQVNASRGDIAYNVIDLAKPEDTDSLEFKSWEAMQEALTNVDAVISTRLILGDDASKGNYYAKKLGGARSRARARARACFPSPVALPHRALLPRRRLLLLDAHGAYSQRRPPAGSAQLQQLARAVSWSR